MVLALAFVYQMGRDHERVHQELGQKIGKQLAKAFDDGFVLGRDTGLKDAAEAPPTDKSLLS
jgi:hypothetical protein